jgi:hypothetical protein
VFHLHRLDRDDRVARRHRLAGLDVDGEDRAGHRGDDLGRSAAARVGRRRPSRAVDVRRGRDPERHGPAVDVDVDGLALAGSQTGAGPSLAVAATLRSTSPRPSSARSRITGGPLSRQPAVPRAAAAADHAASGIGAGLVGRPPDPVERVDPRLTADDRRLADEPAEEAQVRRQAEHDRPVERGCQSAERLTAIAAPRDDLREHRVEAAGHLVAGRDPGSTRTPSPAGQRTSRIGTGRRQEPRLRVLRVEADLHRVAARADVALGEPEGLPGGDPDLVGDEVAARDEARDRVARPGAGCSSRGRRTSPRRRAGTRTCRRSRSRLAASAGRPRSAPRVGGRTAGDGVSSRTFWWRRWIEQSRSPRGPPFHAVEEQLALGRGAGPHGCARGSGPLVDGTPPCASRRARHAGRTRVTSGTEVRIPFQPPRRRLDQDRDSPIRRWPSPRAASSWASPS